MSNITLTIPNDDHIALRAFGKALEEMALAHGAEPRKTVGELSYKLNIDVSEATAALERLNNVITEHPHVEVDTTAQQVESLAALDNDLPIITVDPTCHALNNEELQERGFDSTGTPWDERIHSTSKALNADGTWRLRRKPKDMDEAEWAAFVETVKAELMWKKCDPEVLEQMTDVGMDNSGETSIILGKDGDISINTGVASVSFDPAHGEPPVTPPGDDFHTDANVVSEQTVAGIPPLPVPPPVTTATLEMQVPPPPHVVPVTVQVVDDVQWDFPHLMTFLTERHGKIDVATVNTLLAQDGLASLQELNAHPDKIGPFVARVKAHLGE